MDRFPLVDSTAPDERPPYRPPIGIPMRDEPRGKATIAAILLHALVVLIVLAPTLILSSQLINSPQPQGAGGKGPVGGGGGGTPGGSTVRFVPEKLRYLQLTPTPQPKPE